MQKFYNRTMDLVNTVHPDLLYFDDDISGGLPLLNDDPSVGLRIAAHFYNTNLELSGGKEDGVIAAKKLTLPRREVLLYDIERGASPVTLPQPWETDTCIGEWHYDKALGDRDGYKKSPDVIRSLADIVSKNGNLMLSIPVRADGTLDENEVRFLGEMGDWMNVNGESIYATRPWVVFGEGPAAEAGMAQAAKPVVKGAPTPAPLPLTARDIRFTTSKDGKTLYAIVLGWPASGVVDIKSISGANYPGKVGNVALLGSSTPLTFNQDSGGLHVTLPKDKPGPYADSAIALKITM